MVSSMYHSAINDGIEKCSIIGNETFTRKSFVGIYVMLRGSKEDGKETDASTERNETKRRKKTKQCIFHIHRSYKGIYRENFRSPETRRGRRCGGRKKV